MDIEGTISRFSIERDKCREGEIFRLRQGMYREEKEKRAEENKGVNK